MNTSFIKLLYGWPKPYIRDQDLATIFFMDDKRRYDTVKYAMKKGLLSQIRRGLYLIQRPYQKMHHDEFEIAQAIYGPSYISLESALSYHGWIPEKVNACTSSTVKRSKEFITDIANFTYSHTPLKSFMIQVRRVETSDSTFLIAEPWKAVADHIYVRNRSWGSLADMISDMRIDEDSLLETDVRQLENLSTSYASVKVRKLLAKFYIEILNGHKGNRRQNFSI